MKIANAELIGEMKHYAINAEIEKGKTILLVETTLTEMYDANSDSTAYEFTDNLSHPLTPKQSKELKELAIEWLEAKKCSICNKPEDDDGRCGCAADDVINV